MTVQVPRQPVIDALENVGLDSDEALREKYSGRSMYGNTCLGIVGSESAFALFLVELAYSEREDGDNGQDVARELAGRVRSDQMGQTDMIFYFPGAELAADEDEGEDEGEPKGRRPALLSDDKED